MAMGNPVLLSSTNAISDEAIRPISFSRQDQSSFNETLLQEIVDYAPEVLPIRDFLPAQSVCSLGREIPLDLGERQGFIDNLLVTNDGHLVIVETKLYRNPEAVRDAVVQTLEYGMAVHKMSLLDLEARIRRGDSRGNRLGSNETIRDRAASLKGFSDNFEIALERFQRTGEILLLVVADGIRTSVERITHWMNEHGSSAAIQFGLVELRFYELADGKKIVMPRTLLKTIEVSRHVVVVDIKNETTANVSAIVEDKFKTPSGASPIKTRPVKSAAVPMTQELLLTSLDATNQATATELMEQLESIGLDQGQQPSSSVRYGIEGAGEFLPMFYMYKTGVNAYLPKRLVNLLGTDGLSEFRTKLRQIAPFWSDAQMSDPYTIGTIVRYEQLTGKTRDIISVLEEFKIRATNALGSEGDAA